MHDAYKDFNNVVQEITRLQDLWKQLAFSAACAERLLPFYICYVKQQNFDSNPYFTALDYIWNCLERMEFDELATRRLLMECERALPNEDNAWKAGCPYADDTTAAVLYCLRFLLSRDQQEAIWAAKRAYEVADNFVIAQENYPIDSHDGELKILHHPVIQNELARQLRDLRELQLVVSDSSALQRLCRDLRRNAKSEAAVFFLPA